MSKLYKIRDKDSGLFSSGSINRIASKNKNKVVIVRWSSKKSKQWTDEKLLKKHLLECCKLGGIPSNWEIMEYTQEPSKEIHEWINEQMLMAILKSEHKNEK